MANLITTRARDDDYAAESLRTNSCPSAAARRNSLLTAIIPSMMPFEWMKEIHRYLGMGELPDGPIMGYLTRSLSAMYAMHGAVELFVSWMFVVFCHCEYRRPGNPVWPLDDRPGRCCRYADFLDCLRRASDLPSLLRCALVDRPHSS